MTIDLPFPFFPLTCKHGKKFITYIDLKELVFHFTNFSQRFYLNLHLCLISALSLSCLPFPLFWFVWTQYHFTQILKKDLITIALRFAFHKYMQLLSYTFISK